jgi:predicted DNA-binding WGR domain protein
MSKGTSLESSSGIGFRVVSSDNRYLWVTWLRCETDGKTRISRFTRNDESTSSDPSTCLMACRVSDVQQ